MLTLDDFDQFLTESGIRVVNYAERFDNLCIYSLTRNCNSYLTIAGSVVTVHNTCPYHRVVVEVDLNDPGSLDTLVERLKAWIVGP